MAKTARNLVVMGIVVAGLAGTTPSALGAEPELLAIRILVATVAGVPPDMLVRAQTETARVYAAVGIRLVWEGDPLNLLPHLTMRIVSGPGHWFERVAESALGAVPAGDDGVGRLAYAFHERIQAAARRQGTDPAKILAYVMAHELGHLLLGRSHSVTGIMSGHWDRYEIQSIEMSALRFTNEQGKSIRSTVIEMDADRRRMAGIVAH